MKQGGAVMLGKANLDEFPFGDFGISTVGGTVGNAYDPSLSTAGSSGGSATAVATSLAALGFGTDTCNSLSNPSAFASLATIRATRGLTSRAGVMPLNTYNDAVGPMAKSVRDVALALDLVTGSDPEDPVTADAAQHISGSFAAGLDAATLKGKRIGAFRQRFVGFTGEREIAANMDKVIKELQSAGAIVVDVAIPDYDAKYAAARGAAPGSLRAGWTAYLSRGSKPGDKVLTIQDLLASGKLAPVSARRLEGALAPAPTGAALDEATKRFVAGRETFRQLFVDLMDQQKLDAMLYPANQARPHTHEGGLERYGSEPGTCEESAATGLPQVTVPAGFIGGRYPVGISLLGTDVGRQAAARNGRRVRAGHAPSPPAGDGADRRADLVPPNRTFSSPRSAINFLKCATSRSRRFIIASISAVRQVILGRLLSPSPWSAPRASRASCDRSSRGPSGAAAPAAAGTPREKSIIITFHWCVISTLVRLRSVSRTSDENTRMRYIWWFQSVGFGGWIFFLSRSLSSISVGTNQLIDPVWPYHFRST